MTRILIIDGQGGRIGRQLAEGLLGIPETELTVVGTNSLATGNMLKSGAANAATGENAVLVASRSADIIVGPIGIVIADSLLGEITPAIAAAVGGSRAVKILIPVNRCDNIVVGTAELSVSELIRSAVDTVRQNIG
ncbi:DUF3842 family protein [Feifania hominis]|uniref:DUF3842 family protein n=1 Tax=Feifania hominis TaxID=2763660 RepID=A0A926HTH1_9FIRM|nr:DUF3842 family protein [Feifania hominis]MBC8535864.1 DUF3842 family protein [Feifania hominis]